MRDFLSERAKAIPPSGIRRFFDLAGSTKGIISLGVGEPDFITPWNIREAGINALKRGYTQYTSNSGLIALRNQISKYLSTRFNVDFPPSRTVITVGASEAIDNALRAVINEGDEVLIPDPSYVSYTPCVNLLGGKAVSVPCCEESSFKLTPQNLKSVITKKSKVLIFPYPNNPTGAIMTKEDIEAIIPVILENDLLVIADEIYAELTYGKKHVSIASFKEMQDRVVLISGFSKAFAMTGWRVGYACAPQEIFNAMLKIHQYGIICAPIFSQYASLEGLSRGEKDGYADINAMKAEYDKRRKFMHKTFNDMGLSCFEPEGAFYIFPCVKSLGLDGEEFATKLLEKKKVAVVPGNAFGEFGKYYIRCSYAYSMADLLKATELIAEFVEELKVNNGKN